MRGHTRSRSCQRSRQIVTVPHDCDRHARGLQAQEGGLRVGRATGEAGSVDVDEGDRSAGERAFE
jgi:hypothetical protein